jgi:hypothetical protein
VSHNTLRDEGTHVYLEYGGREMGFVLAEDENGVLQYFPGFVDALAPEQQSGPFSYDSRPKSVSQPIYFDQWTLGAGWEDAPAGSVTFGGYSYSRGIDVSWGVPVLSPERQSYEGLSSGVTKFYHSPTFGDFALDGNHVMRWTGLNGEWSSIYEADNPPTDIIEFSNATDTYLFVAYGAEQDIRYSLTGLSLPQTVAGVREKFFGVKGITSTVPTLWGITEEGEISGVEDPTVAANWSNPDQIGLPSETVTAMVVANNTFWIFKETGWYTFNGTDIGEQLPVYVLRREGNGKSAYVHINGLIYAPYGNRLFEINPVENSVRTVWEASHFEINGDITAIGGDLRYLNFAVKNAEGNTYILKGLPATGAFDTLVYLGANDCDALMVTEKGLTHSANPVLTIGYGSAGAYFIMPRDGYRPWDDDNYRFDLNGGTLYGPWVDGGVMVYEKWLNAARISAENITAARTAEVEYSIDGLSAETSIVTAAVPGLTVGRVDDVDFTRLRYTLNLITGSSRESPQVHAIVFDTTPNPPRHRSWPFVVRAEQRQAQPGGGDARPEAFRDIEDFLFGAAGQRATFTDYWGRTFTVKVLDVRGTGLARKSGGEGRNAAAMDIQVLLAEINANKVHGSTFTWGQSKWGSGDVYGADE